MKDKNINEIILERFGEPIGDAPSLVGVADERNMDHSEPPPGDRINKKRLLGAFRKSKLR
jgi:hypothetical protein